MVPEIRILNAEPDHYAPEASIILGGLGRVDNGPLSRAELFSCVADYEVLIVRLGHQVDRAVLEQGKQLKAVVSATTGLDHIDVDFARSQSIAVLSLRGEVEFLRQIPATAEHTWGLLLSLVRKIPFAFQSALAGQWDRNAFRGHDLAGRTLGILGLGRIGEKVARYAQAFDMQVTAYDPYRIGWIDGVDRAESLDALLGRSQILTIHVPFNETTLHLLDQRQIDLLPDDSLLINTARGDILVERALLAGLEQGHLSGAALDVIPRERSQNGPGSMLLDYARSHSNLIITPHIGGATWESMHATEVFMARKLSDYLRATGIA